jgi:ABC-type lipoprotein export system ATPase subunit
MAAIVATHDPAMIARADRVLDLHDGKLTGSAA